MRISLVEARGWGAQVGESHIVAPRGGRVDQPGECLPDPQLLTRHFAAAIVRSVAGTRLAQRRLCDLIGEKNR